MKRIAPVFIALAAIFTSPHSSIAQKTGSAVLTQTGTEEQSAKNGPYTYDKVELIPDGTKDKMYANVKAWIPLNLKVSNDNIALDATNGTIAVNVPLSLADIDATLSRQQVSFKMVLSFKDGKMRVQANDFQYYGSDARGTIYAKHFEDLRPFVKNITRRIYEDFDKKFANLNQQIVLAAKGQHTNDEW